MSEYFCHPSSIIDEGAQIGKNSRIWHWVHICKTARVGQNCSVGQNVFIGDNAIVGNNVKIQNNVSIYDGVEIEDDVFCGPSMVFTNVYNPRSAIERKHEYRKTHIGKGATLGANCTVVCGVNIGKYAFIGAGSVVRESVPDYALIVGVPGKQIGWMSEYGEQLDLPINGEGSATCPHSGSIFVLTDSVLSKV